MREFLGRNGGENAKILQTRAAKLIFFAPKTQDTDIIFYFFKNL